MSNQKLAVPLLQNVFPLVPMPLLSEVPLDKEIETDEYRKELKELQNRLGELHNRLYRKKVPVIIAYEGWDAAGKGGNIKRITEALDPRGYEVQPIARPEPHEKARHYLWRFWTRLPKSGHIAIFDRTWYGRVMVERIEGFCTEKEWKRAYGEINAMEQDLVNAGAIASYLPAAQSETYNDGNEFYGGQAVYKDIVEFAGRVPGIDYGAYYSDIRSALTDAITNVVQKNADIDTEIKNAQDTVEFNIAE